MIEYNPHAPEIQHNPYPCWRQLRDEAPVYYNPQLDFYAITRYDDVHAAMLDPATFISGEGVTLDGADKNTGFLISLDPPEHTWIRKILSRVFTPRRVGELEPFVRRVAATYLDALRDHERIDLVDDFALRLPLDVIGELIGIPPELRRAAHDLSMRAGARDAMGRANDDAITALLEMVAMYMELAVDRRKRPGDDIISMLVAAEVTDDDGVTHRLSDEMIAAQFMLLGAAGHETVANLLGNGAVALWWYPDQRAELVADPSLMPGAVEEMLRWDNPAPLAGRFAVRDVELHGVTIRAGTRVLLVLGSGNHDERHYDEPERFDIHRANDRPPPLVFGFGIHRCLGAALARLEVRVAFEELLARFPHYAIDEAGVVRGPAQMLRGVKHLPLVLTP